MDRDTLIFIAFCVFILLLGVRFWQQLRERKYTSGMNTGMAVVLQMKRSPCRRKAGGVTLF